MAMARASQEERSECKGRGAKWFRLFKPEKGGRCACSRMKSGQRWREGGTWGLRIDLCDSVFHIRLFRGLEGPGAQGHRFADHSTIRVFLVQDLTHRWDSNYFNEEMNEHSAWVLASDGKLGSSKQVRKVMESCKGRNFPVMEKGKGRSLFLVGEAIPVAVHTERQGSRRNKEVNNVETNLRFHLQMPQAPQPLRPGDIYTKREAEN